MKGISPVQGEVIAKKSKNTLLFFFYKESLDPAGQIQSNLAEIILR
jgi:hypothetical protein